MELRIINARTTSVWDQPKLDILGTTGEFQKQFQFILTGSITRVLYMPVKIGITPAQCPAAKLSK